MWELALIARDYDVRRKAIFEDIDRKDGPMWSQIYKICFDSLKALEKRIDDYGKPPAPPPAPDATAQSKPVTRVVEPPLSANVWQPAPPPKTLGDSLGKLVADVTKSPGKKPIDTIVPQAKKTVAEIRDALLTKQQQERLNREGIVGMWHGSFLWFLQLPIVGKLGWPFQQLYSRRLTTAVLGSPYGDASLYVNAAFTLSRLAVASLNEDNYGNVQRDVATIIRALTTVIKKLEIFQENFPIHWTDTQGERRCEEVDEVLDALKEALGRVVGAFERYSSDLRLNRTDKRLAKEAAEKKGQAQAQAQEAIAQVPGENQPEMRQIG
jgi:nucleoporin NDC1